MSLVPFIALAIAGPAASISPADLLTAGDTAFRSRADPDRLAAALAAYRQASAAGQLNADLRLARAEAFRALSDRWSSREAWGAVSRAAERALRRSDPDWARAIDEGLLPGPAAAKVGPKGAEALYWLALATFSGAQVRGFAAVLAVKDAALAMMERAVALDETVDHAGPRRALGTWIAALPFAAGGGATVSRQQFDRARSLAPTYLFTRLREAETLCVLLQDRQRFEALLSEILAFDETTSPEVAPENQIAKQRARELLARVDGLF